MKIRNVLILLASAVVSAACATATTRAVDMIAEGSVQVTLQKSDDVIYSKVDVHQHGDETEIQIVVRPPERVRYFAVGTIKMVVNRPDGSHQEIVTDKARVDHHDVGSKLQHAHFIVVIPYTLPTGTDVTVSYEPSK